MKKSARPFWLTTALTLAAGATVQAQQSASPTATDDTGSQGLAEVVVTARYRAERLQDIGMSADVLSGDHLARSGVRDVADLAAMTPGLDITDRGPNQSNVSFRGMASSLAPTNWQRSNALVGLYLDDVSVVTPFSNQRSWNMFDLDRVEVVRGPQGTLYGEGAMGGAIRYVTADPSLTEFNGRAALTGSYYDSSNGGNYRGDATISAPLIQDKAGVRLTGFYEHDAGYVDFARIGVTDGNDYRTAGARLVLLALPTDALRTRLSVTYEDSRLGSESIVTGDASKLTNTNNIALQPQLDKALVVSGRADYKLPYATVTAITGFQDRHREDTGEEPVATGSGVPATKIFTIADRGWSEDLRYVSTLQGPFNFTLGGYYKASQQHAPLIETGTTAPLAGVLLHENEFYDSKHFAVFGEARYDILPQLHATAGVRYFRESVDANQLWTQPVVLYNFVPTNGFSTNLTINKVLPKFLLEYQAERNVLLYAGVTEGARNGGLNVTSTITIANFLGSSLPRTYRPDSATSYEAGAKTTWFDDRLVANVAAYFIDWRQLQAQAGSPPLPFGPTQISLGYFTNVGSARSVGSEFELTWHPDANSGVTLSGGYTDARIRDAFLVNTVTGSMVLPDTRVPFVPKYKAATSLFHTVHLSQAASLTGTVQYQYVASQAAGLKTVPENNPNLPFYEVPAYGLLNVRLALGVHSWSVTAFADNVTNKLVGLAPGSSTLPQGLNYYVNRPRTVGVTLMDTF